MTPGAARSPIFFEVSVARLPKRGMPVVIEADERQRNALAKFHGLLEVAGLRAELQLSGWNRNGVKVDGRVEAQIVQSCVVTLDPVPETIDEKFSAVYLPDDSKLGREGFGLGGEVLIDIDGPDGPETFSGDRIDVGALAEEHFALAINPYPRKSGVVLAVDPALPDAAPQDDRAIRKLGSLFPKT